MKDKNSNHNSNRARENTTDKTNSKLHNAGDNMQIDGLEIILVSHLKDVLKNSLEENKINFIF